MTTSARSASRSVTLPLPSSPHWAPTTTRPGMRSASSCRVWRSSLESVGRGRSPTAEVAFLVHVGELRIAAQEREHHLADRAVPVLGDDDVRLARPLRVAVVVLVAVDEHDDVGVLLDLTGLAQVGEQRLLVGPRLDRARQLGDRDDRHLQLARELFETAADLADLLDAVLRRVLGPHQLEVVDDDQAEPV